MAWGIHNPTSGSPHVMDEHRPPELEVILSLHAITYMTLLSITHLTFMSSAICPINSSIDSCS